MRRYDDAIRAGGSAIANNPNDAEACNGLGVVLHDVGRSEEALPCFERAMALDPLCPGMWLHFQGQAYYQLRRYEEAEVVLKRRIFRTPETDASRVLLAATYGQTGRLDEAREQWRERRSASTRAIPSNTGARCCPTRTLPTSRPSSMGSEGRG